MTMVCSAKLTFDMAQNVLRSQTEPLDSETVPVQDCGLRILAEPLFARIDSPRQDVAAMDGFAVEDSAIQQGSRIFSIAGERYAGDQIGEEIGANTAVRIATGAPMPPSKDRVIPFELTVEIGELLQLQEPPPKALHVRKKGSGFQVGQSLLAAGTLLDPARLHLVSASDQPVVRVFKRPRVCLVTNGNELTASGKAAATTTHIPDSLTLPLTLMVTQWGGEMHAASLVGDDPDAITTVASGAVTGADILVIAGGASHGDRDFSRPALMPLGLETLFEGVSLKPGKPVWYGRLGKLHVLGLPGNPAAAMTIARLFLMPLIYGLSGRPYDDALRWWDMPLTEPIAPSPDRDMFLFGRVSGDKVEILPRQPASAHLPLASAELLVWVPPGGSPGDAGNRMRVLRF